MPELNLTTTRNEVFTPDEGTPDERRYWPYPPGKELDVLRQAIWIIEHNVYKKNNQCNKYFQSLPGRRSFDEIWEDTRILINYDPRWPVIKKYGTIPLGYHEVIGGLHRISLTDVLFADLNRWQVAGLLIHELAHADGAPGIGSGSDAADRAQIHCGLSNFFDHRIG